MIRFHGSDRPFLGRRAAVRGFCIITLFFCAIGSAVTAHAQCPATQPPSQTIVFDSDQTGRSEIYMQNLGVDLTKKPFVYCPLGGSLQLTNGGAAQQASQEPQFSLAASVNATRNPDSLGRIVFQFGASGHRGLHLIKPIAIPANNGDVQLTLPPLDPTLTPFYTLAAAQASTIQHGPIANQFYPCTDVRDPSWSPDGRYIVYSCLESAAALTNILAHVQGPVTAPQPNGINPASYDLWIHDTNGTPDDPSDDADYPLLTLNGQLALRPAWSPDGSMIAYMTNIQSPNGPAPTSKIGLAPVPPDLGTSLSVQYSGTILTDDKFNDVAPTWDPGSSWVAFSSTRKDVAGVLPSGNRTIWKIKTDRTGLSQVTGKQGSSANDTNPSWSTGSYIAFASDRLNSNGTNATRVWIIDSHVPEDTGGMASEVTGLNASYQGNDQDPAFGRGGLLGIDISDSAGLISVNQWNQIIAAGVSVVVVNAYPGVDNGYDLSAPPNPLPSNFPSTCCQFTQQNLLNAQSLGLYTGVYSELTFVPNSQKPTSNGNAGPAGYGVWAVQQARRYAGPAWPNLDFVAIAVEPAPGVTPVGLASDHVTQISNAVAEANRDSNPVIYTSRGASGWPQVTADSTSFAWLPFWEAGVDDKTANLGTFKPFDGWQTGQGKQYDCSPDTSPLHDCAGNGIYVGGPLQLQTSGNGVILDLDIFDPGILAQWPGNTAAGSNIFSSVVNFATGLATLTATFTNVTQPGFTSVTTTSSGPPIPAGFQLGNPATYYDVTTTALFTGLVQVCLDYTGISFGSQNLVMLHYENGQWVNRTASVDTVNHIICASVTSLSPFVILQPALQVTPTVTVSGGTFVYDGAAHGANATASGVSGAPVSGSFTFTYTPGGSSPPVNIGTYSVTAQFTSTDPNYTNASTTGTITITPAPTPTQTTTPTGSMRFARVSHQATLLADGLVLVSGGQNGGTAIPESELYNPATGTWSLTGSNIIPRFDHTATLLLDGRVLAAGGVSSTGDCSSNVTSETYDPTTGQWTSTSRLPSPVGTGHNAIRLLDGRVLVSGGGDRCGNVFSTAAIFDPSTNKWSAASNMTAAREFHSAELLPDGRVLVAGGVATSPFPAVASAEIYDPTTNVWTAVVSMGTARETSCNGYTEPYLANLGGGAILAAGGFSGPNCHAITPQRTVTGVTVNPSQVQLSGAGHAQALTVTAQMSDGSMQAFTGPLQFASADSTVAAVDSDGLVTAVGAGTTTITVTATGIAPVTVATSVASRQLTSISVSPVSVTMVGAGLIQPLAVNGQYSDGSQQALTSGVTFTSSNPSVASVDATGLITSAANGTATITVSAQGAPAVQIPITVKSLVSIAVSPTSVTLNSPGQVQVLTVTGLFTDSSQQILTGTASFVSSDPTVVRVDLSGNVTAVANGIATISVSVAGVGAVQVPVTIAPKPVLLSSNPNNGLQGQQNLSVSLTGQVTNWVQGTTTATFGAGITVTALAVNSPTSATALLNIDPAAAPGARTITFTTGTEIETLTNGFTIVAQTAVLVSVNPPIGQLGQQNLFVSLTGQFTNWVQGTTTASFGAGITVSSLTVNSPTSATAVLTIDPATTTGPRTVTMTTGSEVATLLNGFAVVGGPMEVDAKPFSVLNLAGVTGGQPIQLESDAVPFSVLNTSGAGGTGGGQSSEADAVDFSVLNLAGVTGGQPVGMEADAVPFSVLNTAGPGGTGGGSASLFEFDPLNFSVLNLAGMSGNQPVQMEVDAVPFSVQNGTGPVAQAAPSNSVRQKQATQTKAKMKDVSSSSGTKQDSGGTNISSSAEQDKQRNRQ